jgi:hypothetical protein
VGERACACRGARIPEEGAKRLTSLDWVLGEVWALLIIHFFIYQYLPKSSNILKHLLSLSF